MLALRLCKTHALLRRGAIVTRDPLMRARDGSGAVMTGKVSTFLQRRVDSRGIDLRASHTPFGRRLAAAHHRIQFRINARRSDGKKGEQQGHWDNSALSGEGSDRADQERNVLRAREAMVAILDKERLYIG
jgi:hypothetical protein